MKLKDLMTDQLHCCKRKDTASEAAKMMREYDINIVPVVNGEKIIGVITDHDIVVNVVAEGRNPNEVLIENCMTSDIVTAHPEMEADEALDLMEEHDVRALPIIDRGEGHLIGLVTLADVTYATAPNNEAILH